MSDSCLDLAPGLATSCIDLVGDVLRQLIFVLGVLTLPIACHDWLSLVTVVFLCRSCHVQVAPDVVEEGLGDAGKQLERGLCVLDSGGGEQAGT